MSQQETRPFIDALRTRYGDRKLIERRLSEGIGALRARGVEPYYTRGLRRLVRLNRDHAASWSPLFPALDPDIAGFTDRDSFMIEGRLPNGELAFTDAARLLRLPRSTFKQELESFRLYYRDPERQRSKEERIAVTAPSADRITGIVALIGGVWIHPALRGTGLAEIFTPLLRWYTYTSFNPDWTAALIHAGAARAGIAQHYGHPISEPAILMDTRAVQGTLHLICQSRRQIEAHIRLGTGHLAPIPAGAEP